MNNHMNFFGQGRRSFDEQSQQRLSNQLVPAPMAAFLRPTTESPAAQAQYSLQGTVSSPGSGSSMPFPSAASGEGQLSSLNISQELKRLQQLNQLTNAAANPLLIGPSTQSGASDPSTRLLQSYLEQKVQTQRFDDPLRLMGMSPHTQSLLKSPLLQDPRILMAQGNLQTTQQQMMNTRSEIPLPSPHSLFHRDGSRRMRGGVIEPFPEKLHRLLLEVEAAGRSDVISFVANGRAFAIHKPDKFFKEIVPLYFRQSRLSSFKRQLNLYGFELINTGPARGGYYHDLFVKDRPELCRRMRRVAVKVMAKSEQNDLGSDSEEKRTAAAAKENSADAEEKEERGDDKTDLGAPKGVKQEESGQEQAQEQSRKDGDAE